MHVTGAEGLKFLTARMAAANCPQLPLFQAAQAGRISLAKFERPNATWPAKLLKAYRRPVVLLIGDDPWPAGQSQGPAGWSCASRLRHWIGPCPVIIHGAVGDPADYRSAAEGAEKFGRCLLVETDSVHALEWAEFIAAPHMVVLLPPPGAQHPLPLDRSGMH